jgi:hypothetical protein
VEEGQGGLGEAVCFLSRQRLLTFFFVDKKISFFCWATNFKTASALTAFLSF